MVLEMKFKRELETFFRLTIVNIVIAAVTFGLGIGLATHQLGIITGAGELEVLSLILTGLGVAILAAGFFWLITAAEIMHGVSALKTAYEKAGGSGDDETITVLMIEMMAYYRSNMSAVSKMAVLGKVSGVLALYFGAQTTFVAAMAVVSDEILVDTAVQLLGGIVLLGVGSAALFIIDKFNKYSKLWSERLKETADIGDALQQKLEAD